MPARAVSSVVGQGVHRTRGPSACCFLPWLWRSERTLSLTDGEPDLSLQLLVTDQCRDAHTTLGNVRSEAVKPDKMEETLTCIICQDLLHDCVRYAPRRGRSGCGEAALWVLSGSVLQRLSLSFYSRGQRAQSPAPVTGAVEEPAWLVWDGLGRHRFRVTPAARCSADTEQRRTVPSFKGVW